jgi:flagellar basal body P-ring formation protein FlgA
MLRVWRPVLLPDEPLTLKVIELPNAGVSASFIVRFQLSTAREVLGTWQMPLQAKIWRDVWVAKSPLRSGQLLADADIGRERRDVLGLRDLLPEEPRENLELVESVSAGTPLTSRSVRPKPVVHRGQMVDAQVQDGTLLISLRVEVLENGAPGQNIRVRNVQSRREFRGKVINEQTILVSL